ncbi:hypothetical protein [Amycolatopsis sp. lyj-346]|uniref:hypothetical protein n=1 Tax=Amycolatopsis sp. lyj-346 TaxID=2789289 RepID=UPI00397D73C5
MTEEQIAAAQLRVYLDQKQGRTTPDVVQKIADSLPGAELADLKATPLAAVEIEQPEEKSSATDPRRTLAAAILRKYAATPRHDETADSETLLSKKIYDQLVFHPWANGPSDADQVMRKADAPPSDIIWLPHHVDDLTIEKSEGLQELVELARELLESGPEKG